MTRQELEAYGWREYVHSYYPWLDPLANKFRPEYHTFEKAVEIQMARNKEPDAED